VRRQALELSVSRFDDVTRLRKVLDQTLAEAPTRPIMMTPPQTQLTPQRQAQDQTTARAAGAAAADAAAGLSHGRTAAASGNRHTAAGLPHGPLPGAEPRATLTGEPEQVRGALGASFSWLP
jgi:hypothetical protein